MEINRLLLKQQLERIFYELYAIKQDIEHFNFVDSEEVGQLIARKERQLEGIKLSLSYSEGDAQAVDLKELAAAIHQTRLEIRLARRRWKKAFTTEARFRKIQDRKQVSAPGYAA